MRLQQLTAFLFSTPTIKNAIEVEFHTAFIERMIKEEM